jgi:type III secretion protein J
MGMLKLKLLLVVALVLTGCRETIVHDLEEREANRLMGRLNEAAMAVHKERQTDGKWSLSVPTSRSIEAIKRLAKERLLKTDKQTKPVAAGPLTSREDQKFRYERNLSREIETTLASIEGILEARVHLNIPAIDPIFGSAGDSSTASASVLLITDMNFKLGTDQIAGLVGGAAGVPVKKIAVLTSTIEETSVNFAAIAAQSNPSVAAIQQKNIIGGYARNNMLQAAVVLIAGGFLALLISFGIRLRERGREY